MYFGKEYQMSLLILVISQSNISSDFTENEKRFRFPLWTWNENNKKIFMPTSINLIRSSMRILIKILVL